MRKRSSGSFTTTNANNQSTIVNSSFPAHHFEWKRLTGKNCDSCNQSFWLSFGYECSNCGIFVHKGCIKSIETECRTRSEIFVLSHTNQILEGQGERERFFKLNGIKKEDHINRIFYSTVDRKLVALSDNGDAFSINIESFPEELAIVKPMKLLPTRQIIQVSAGANHTLFLADNGHIYSWGSNQYGQLGVGNEMDDSSSPVLITSLVNKVTDKVCCGGHHSLILTIDGEVYAWGMGENGRLGNNSEENQYFPINLNQYFSFPFQWEDNKQIVTSSSSSLKNKMQGITISMPAQYQDAKYIEVKVDSPSSDMSSRPHISSTKDVLAHSTSITSQLSSVSEPLSPEEMALRMMSTLTQTFSSLKDNQSTNFNSEYSPIEKRETPSIVSTFTKPVICSITAGWGHSLVLFRCRRLTAKIEETDGVIRAKNPVATHRSVLFTFGKSDFGQCGHGNTLDVKSPKIISSLRNEAIYQVTGGFYHSSVLTDDGKVFCFGASSEGQCGPLEDKRKTFIDNPIRVDVPSPAKMITSGNFHNIVQCVTGEVYVWGRLFNSTNFTPSLVEKLSGKKIVSMISGMLSTIVVVADSADTIQTSDAEQITEEGHPINIPQGSLNTGGQTIGSIWNSVSKGVSDLTSPLASPVGSPNSRQRNTSLLQGAEETFWSPFTNFDDTQQLILKIRKGVPDSHRLKVWLFVSGCTELLSTEEGLYARSIRAAYSAEEVQSATNQGGDLTFDDIPSRSFSSLNGYLPEGFSYQNHNLSEDNVRRMQRLLWVLYKKATPHFMFLHPILPDLICILLHYTSEEQAYFTTWALFNQPKVSDFSQFNIPEIFSSVVLNALRMCAPDLHNHLDSIVDTENCYFATSWFARLFVGKFPYRIVLRIFDCFISEGILVLFRVAIAIFLLNSDQLLKCTNISQIVSELDNFMTNCKDDDAVLELAYGVSFRRNSCLDYLRSSRDATMPPNIDEISQILDHEQISTLWLWLPVRCRLDEPRLIFSTSNCGFNISTMVSKCSNYNPTILLIKTSEGHVFGSFITANWEKGDKFNGSGETFVFSLSPKMRKYPWTKENTLFFLVSNALMIGGGGSGCSLYLDDELNHGSCNRSATFDNPNLCGNKKDFDAIEVEVIGWDTMKRS